MEPDRTVDRHCKLFQRLGKENNIIRYITKRNDSNYDMVVNLSTFSHFLDQRMCLVKMKKSILIGNIFLRGMMIFLS